METRTVELVDQPREMHEGRKEQIKGKRDTIKLALEADVGEIAGAIKKSPSQDRSGSFLYEKMKINQSVLSQRNQRKNYERAALSMKAMQYSSFVPVQSKSDDEDDHDCDLEELPDDGPTLFGPPNFTGQEIGNLLACPQEDDEILSVYQAVGSTRIGYMIMVLCLGLLMFFYRTSLSVQKDSPTY